MYVIKGFFMDTDLLIIESIYMVNLPYNLFYNLFSNIDVYSTL